MSFIQQFFTSRDNNANAETFVGQEGRLWWDPITNQIYSSDGNTPGGIPLAGGGGNGTPGGSNSQVQFNQNGSFGGTANVTINSATGALTAVSFVGNSFVGNNVQFNTGVTPITAAAGQMFWDTGEHTISLGMENGVTQQIGLEQYMYIKADSAISDGQVVMFAGANGNNLLGVPADTTSPGFKPEYIMGIATQDIARNGFGYVTTFGLVHGLTTNAYTVGDILWVNNAVPGGLTNVQPADPNFQIQMAAVTKASGGDGHIMVRPTPFYDINRITNVNTTSPTNGQALVYDSANSIWVNGNVANATYATTAGTAYSVNAANVSGTVANATYALSANSATSLINGSSFVVLNSDGTMTFPNNVINSDANPITLWSTNSSSLLWRDAAGGTPSEPVQTIIEAGNGSATITVSTGVLAVQSQKIWTFNTAGNTVFPDSTVQTTAYPGNATTLSLSGNITGGYILGNGSQLTGLPATYSNANVATFLANFGSNVISTTGNVTGGNVIGTTGVSVGGTGGDLTMTGGAITGAGNITSNGIMAINAPGGITTTSTSFDIVNTTATTVNIGGSATAVNIGATTGTLTINNPNIVATQASIAVFNTTATAANIFGAASTIIMGAAGAGTLTLRNGTIVGSQATQNLFNTVATTMNFAGAATTLNIGGAGNTIFSANTQVRVSNTGGSALSVAGNITGGNIIGTHVGNLTGTTVSVTGNITSSNVITTGAVYSNYNTNTANTGSFMATGGNTKGGTGYLDFLVAQNTSGGATNPYKWLRVNSTGGLEVINSAYTSALMLLSDAGGLSVSGSYQVAGKQAVNGPAFRAYVDAGQAITSGSQQKVTFNGETFDTNSNFASSRFTPTVEGYYQLNATVRIAGGSGTSECMMTIWKNGSEYARGTNESGTEQGANFYSMQVSDLAYANGSTDYFEIYIQQTSGSNKDTTAGTNISYFSGAMVRGA